MMAIRIDAENKLFCLILSDNIAEFIESYFPSIIVVRVKMRDVARDQVDFVDFD